MWIVKLGGSLAGSRRLGTWLAALASRSGLVLVPGGGPFADAVRSAQRVLGFDDATAHHLALLAMEQYGRALCALHPGLAPASTPAEIEDRLRAGLTPVWLPVPMALADPELPRSWDLTSDSLAAWLCGQLGADALLIVKSAPLPPGPVSLDALAREGIVDPLLDSYALAGDMPVYLLTDADLDRLDGLMAGWPGKTAAVVER